MDKSVIENAIIDDYRKGVNNKELCVKYGKSRSYIQLLLKKNNIDLRNGCEVTKKYMIDENYFANIDNSDKAYILGLIFADGTLHYNTVRLNLIESDAHILYDIAKKIYMDDNYQIVTLNDSLKQWKNGNIYHSKKQKLLTFTRKKIADDLRKYGLIEKKSYTIRFPKINNIYYNDFIRGYFDGDGCFYSSKNYKNNNRVYITSNDFFIQELNDIIHEFVGIDCIMRKSNIDGISILQIFGNLKTKKFLDWIYCNSSLKLNRKYEHYTKIYY